MRVTQKNWMWRRNNLSFRKWRDRVCTYYASNYYWGERRGRRGGEGEKVVWSNVVTTRSEEFRLNFEKFSFLARPVLKGISLRVERTTKYDSASSTRLDVFSKISRSNREIWIDIKKRGGCSSDSLQGTRENNGSRREEFRRKMVEKKNWDGGRRAIRADGVQKGVPLSG